MLHPRVPRTYLYTFGLKELLHWSRLETKENRRDPADIADFHSGKIVRLVLSFGEIAKQPTATILLLDKPTALLLDKAPSSPRQPDISY